jgi:hypothetical protein
MQLINTLALASGLLLSKLCNEWRSLHSQLLYFPNAICKGRVS